MRLIVLVLAALIGAASFAAPPYDVTATFNAASGIVDGYRLYQGCRAGETKSLVGAVTSGQTFTGLLTSPGEYSFCVHAFNTTGEGPSSNIAVVNITDIPDVPGAVTNFTITVACANNSNGLPSCSVTAVQ